MKETKTSSTQPANKEENERGKEGSTTKSWGAKPYTFLATIESSRKIKGLAGRRGGLTIFRNVKFLNAKGSKKLMVRLRPREKRRFRTPEGRERKG